MADGPTSALADGSVAGAIPSAATLFVLAPFATHEPKEVQGGVPFQASVGVHATLRPAAEVTPATCCGFNYASGCGDLAQEQCVPTKVMGLPPIPCVALSSAVSGLGSAVPSLPLPPLAQIPAALASVLAVLGVHLLFRIRCFE